MKQIKIGDITIKKCISDSDLNFKEKMEVIKNLDKIGVDIIEMPPVTGMINSMLVKSVAPYIENSVISIEAGLNKKEVDAAAKALEDVKNKRINIVVPVSPVQMEFITGIKPKKLLEKLEEIIEYAKSKCDDLELTCIDATRAEIDYVVQVINMSVAKGVNCVTVCDTAGRMLPTQFEAFLQELQSKIESKDFELAVCIDDNLKLSVANSVMAVQCGASVIKTILNGTYAADLEEIVNIFNEIGDSIDSFVSTKRTDLQKILRQMPWLKGDKADLLAIYSQNEGDIAKNEISLDENSDIEKVIKTIKKLGYELSDDDNAKVFKEFKRVAEKKKVGAKELEAIVATTALQVPATYQLVDFVINSGNIITPTCQVTLEKEGNKLKGLSTGDGPISAALLAAEMIIGHHYELDDFHVQSITEGSEAIGSAIVKLRNNGKLYSGNGLSTDIIGASIRAYINAINKIVYEEQNAN